MKITGRKNNNDKQTIRQQARTHSLEHVNAALLNIGVKQSDNYLRLAAQFLIENTRLGSLTNVTVFNGELKFFFDFNFFGTLATMTLMRDDGISFVNCARICANTKPFDLVSMV